MSKFAARRTRLGIAREAVRGVGEEPVMRLPFTDMSFASKVTDVRVGSALGRLADSEQRHVLTKYAEGDIAGEVRDQSFGYLLYALTGYCNTTGPTDTTAYLHTFTPLDNSSQHDTLTMTVQDPNHIVAHELAALQSLEIECPLDNVAAFTSTWMSRVQQPSGHHVPAVTTDEQKFVKKGTTVKLASTIAGLAAASAISLRSFRLTFNKNLVMDDVLGTVWPEDFLVGNFGVEGEFEINWNDQTYRDYFLNETAMAMELQLVADTLITGAAASYPTLKFQFPQVDFFGWEPIRPLDDIASQTVSFKCNFDIANALEIVYLIELLNATSTYA